MSNAGRGLMFGVPCRSWGYMSIGAIGRLRRPPSGRLRVYSGLRVQIPLRSYIWAQNPAARELPALMPQVSELEASGAGHA